MQGRRVRSRSSKGRSTRLGVWLCLSVVGLAACAGEGDRRDVTLDGPASTTPSTAAGSPAPPAVPPESVQLRAEPVADLGGALAMAVRKGDDALYVAQKSGTVRAVANGGRVDPEPVVDLSEEVSTGGEQGLLGIAFDPSGERLYANFTDTAGDTRIVEWEMDGRRARPDSRRQLLFVKQPFVNHNGGHVAFGPDGLLYLALGDGGSGGDPEGNAQRLDTLLGKILRIDPRPAGTDAPYRIPPDNPFVDRPGARPEIWSYGLRNPWRFSFDPAGRMWIGDVGQNAIEEVDRAPAGSKGGENYGWNLREGWHPFRGGERPSGAVDPVHEYPTSEGCSVTGGYVYRGRAVAGLEGVYVFGDFCNGKVKGLVGDDHRLIDLGLEVKNLASFAEDQAGELYVLSLSQGLLRLVAA